MNFFRDSNAVDFFKHAQNFLYQDEVANSLMIGILEGVLKKDLAEQAKVLFIRVELDGKLELALIRMPDKPLVFSRTKLKVNSIIVDYIFNTAPSITDFVGDPENVKKFTDLWQKLSGVKLKIGMKQMIYKLDHVIMPNNVMGEMVNAKAEHIKLIAFWLYHFALESLPKNEQKSVEEMEKLVTNFILNHEFYLWMKDDVPVSMAKVSRPTLNTITIGAVYTPPEHRKRGFASMLVASLSALKLNEGKKFCVLYTDASNPTSNKIYKNMGYHHCVDSAHYTQG